MENMKFDNDWVYEIELELTTNCNLSCPLCARNREESMYLIDGTSRPLNEIIKQLDTFVNFKNCCLAGMLSEPTLYEDLFELIKYLNMRNIEIELYTNGDTHDDDYWYELGKLTSSITKVYFTICGSTQEVHEKYRVNSNLSNILSHHSAFKRGSKHNNDYLQHIMFEYNKDDFENMGYIRSLFSNECNIESAPYAERFGGDICGVTQRIELSEKYNKIKELTKMHRNNKIVDCKSYEDHFIIIDNNGKIFPCFLYRMYIDEDWNLDYGDILRYKYDFCYECERKSFNMIKSFKGLERMT
jgi:MoaA/NifB/PqqE/SkfB family radical SAM enzyme